MTICRINGCSFNNFSSNTECALHSEKNDYHTDSNSGLLRRFFDELITEIGNFLFRYTQETNEINKIKVIEYLNNKELRDENIDEFCKKSTIVFRKIKFPKRDYRDNFDYLNVLRKFGGLHFQDCEIHALELDVNGVKCFFQNCQFHQTWYIHNTSVLPNVSSVLYQSCIFHQNVLAASEGEIQSTVDVCLFDRCEFLKSLELYNTKFSAPVFNNTDYVKFSINNIKLNDCIFDEKFILNKCEINTYNSDGCIFNSKFEFKENIIKDFNVKDTNHYKLVDMYKTQFRKFNIHKSIFSDFVGFEKCEFGLFGYNSKEYIAVFMFATFLSFVNFRKTTFNSGLDIEHINLKESPNFLNIKILSNNSNRETFRIIKNSFDKIGNSIEANKFYVYEMKKYKKELETTKHNPDKFILYLNEKISDFGQSYVKPIIWTVVTSIVYTFLVYGYQKNLIYKVYTPANSKIEIVVNLFNTWATNILPFHKVLKPGMEFISLLFYIIFTVLLWQTLVALKRHTRK